MRDPRAARRSENRTAELSLFRRYGRALAEGQTVRPDRKFRAVGLAAADHGHAEEGGGGRIFGGDPLLQCRPQAAPTGEGRDGPLYARGRTRLRRRAQATGGVGASTSPDESTVLQLRECALKFGLRVHYDRAIPGNRFLDRLAG